jgi:hypothetical protein
VLLLGLAFGVFFVRVAGAVAGRTETRPRRSFAALWLLATMSLVAIYAVQELLEGVFAAGHPSGLTGLFGNGGWWSFAPAVVLGAAVAGLLRVASAVVAAAVRVARAPRRWPAAVPSLRPRSAAPRLRGVLASAAAGRAPPLT